MPEHLQRRPLRVLVVDDHDLFRAGLRELLGEEGFEVGEAASGEAALRRVPGFAPDVVLMDLGMAEMSGIEATRRLQEAAPAARVVVLTTSEEEDNVLDAIRAGASGYLLKESALHEIAAGIRAAADGHSAMTPRVARVVVDELRRGGQKKAPVAEPALDALSVRERQVLALIADGYDNTQIARRLFVSPSTVKNHVSSLFDKLGLDNRVQAATYAIRHGISTGERLAS